MGGNFHRGFESLSLRHLNIQARRVRAFFYGDHRISFTNKDGVMVITQHPPARNRNTGLPPRGALSALIVFALLMAGCHAGARSTGLTVTDTVGSGAHSVKQRYAGEVLGHMMAVVTGVAGQTENRLKWRTRGLNIPLRFSLIQQLMADPESDKSKLLVYDTEIIGLSRVLYHYDPRLNQFKGAMPLPSPFPSDELIALRLLLIRKIASKEKIRLEAVLERLPAVINASDRLTDRDYLEMGLSEAETMLLADACRSEPALTEYIRHPAVISALDRMGILDKPLRLQPAAAGPVLAKRHPPALAVISVLPSFQTAFSPAVVDGRERLVATDAYRQLTMSLKKRILSASADIMADAARRHFPDLASVPGKQLSALWQTFTESRIIFFMPEIHPLAITPYTADGVVHSVCPTADLNIFLLGRDVIRSMDIRPERDVFPHTNRFYVDESDVKYGVIENEVGQIGKWLVEKIGQAFLQDMRRGGLS